MVKFARIALLGVVLASAACGPRDPESSEVKSLFVQSSIASLSFALDGNKLYLAEGNKVLPWAHEAPTVAGTSINFKGKKIGDTNAGYFCNGPYDAVCDASIYENRNSSISMKTGTTAPAAGANVVYLRADTKNLNGIKLGVAVNGIAKGTCSIATDKGQKLLNITAERKIAKVNGKDLEMIEVKTPVWRYSASDGLAPTAEMKVLQRVFKDASQPTQFVQTTSNGVSDSNSVFRALFN